MLEIQVHQQDQNPSNARHFRAFSPRVGAPRSAGYCNAGAKPKSTGPETPARSASASDNLCSVLNVQQANSILDPDIVKTDANGDVLQCYYVDSKGERIIRLHNISGTLVNF